MAELYSEGWQKMEQPPSPEQIAGFPIISSKAGNDGSEIEVIFDVRINEVKHDVPKREWFIREKPDE